VNHYPALVLYICVSLVSIFIIVRKYRAATPPVRLRIVAAGIGALTVAAIILGFIANR